MGSGGIRRSGISVPGPSSDGWITKHRQLNPGVYEIGASPERITRASVERRATFIYRGSCAIRPVPEHDCRSYRVEASGTIDGPEWATIRQMNLTLECSH